MANAKRETPSTEQRRAHVGRTVTWRSGGGGMPPNGWGEHLNRTGVVVEYVPEMLAVTACPVRPSHGTDISRLSTWDRYVVREDRVGAKGQPLAPHWYSPRAGIIDAAIKAEEAKK